MHGRCSENKKLKYVFLTGQNAAHFYYEQIKTHQAQRRFGLYQMDFTSINQYLPSQLDKAAELLKNELELISPQIISKWILANVTLHEVLAQIDHPLISKFDSIYAHLPSKIKKKKLMLIGSKYTMNSEFVRHKFEGFQSEIIAAQAHDQDLIESLRLQFYKKVDKNLAKQIFNHLLKKYADTDYFIILCTEHAMAASFVKHNKLVNLVDIQCQNF